MDDIRLGGAGAEDSSGPLGINVATEEAEYSEVEALAQDALSSNPDVSIEEEESLIVETPAEDVLSSTSSVSTKESESESFESESESESEFYRAGRAGRGDGHPPSRGDPRGRADLFTSRTGDPDTPEQLAEAL